MRYILNCILWFVYINVEVNGSKLLIRNGPHDTLTLRCCISVSQGFCRNQSWMTDYCAQFCFNHMCQRIVKQIDEDEDVYSNDEPKNLFDSQDLIGDIPDDFIKFRIPSLRKSKANSVIERTGPSLRMIPHPTLGKIPAFVNLDSESPMSFDDFVRSSLVGVVEEDKDKPREELEHSHDDHEDHSNIELVTSMRWNGPENMPMASNFDKMPPKEKQSICCELKGKNGCSKDPIWMQNNCAKECQLKNPCDRIYKLRKDPRGQTENDDEVQETEIADRQAERGQKTEQIKIKGINGSDIFELQREIARLQRERQQFIKMLKNSPNQNWLKKEPNATLVPIHSIPNPFKDQSVDEHEYMDENYENYDNVKKNAEQIPWLTFNQHVTNRAEVAESVSTPLIYAHVHDSRGNADYISSNGLYKSHLSSCLHWSSDRSAYSFQCPEGTVGCGSFVRNGQPTTTPSLDDVCLKSGVQEMGSGCKCSANDKQRCFCWCDHKNDCNTSDELKYKYDLCNNTLPSYRNLYKEIGWIQCHM